MFPIFIQIRDGVWINLLNVDSVRIGPGPDKVSLDILSISEHVDAKFIKPFLDQFYKYNTIVNTAIQKIKEEIESKL